ncbi:MAG: TonB-dependent receptor, partial [Muribaculaceae bacterium]|nr:TonB-dependent receptor [Muribaculaceae bacterium]
NSYPATTKANADLRIYNQVGFFRTDTVNIGINQNEAALMGEYSGQFGNWGLSGNLKAVYRHLRQDRKNLDRLFLTPRADISYRPADRWFIRYSASLDHKMPSAAEISDVSQNIQSGMLRRGNPDLKPFRVISQSLDASFRCRPVTADARIEYRNEHNPVMESVIFDNGQFVRTFFNQRSFQRLVVGGSLSLRPWKDHLSITASPVLTRYFSHGLDYSHCHNIFRLGLSVDFSYGNWLAYGNIMSGPANSMYGEEIIEEKDMNQIMIGYKRDKWSVHAGVFNAFINYWMQSRNLSALTPYRSVARSGHNSSYIAVRFSLMLDFGRKAHDVDIRHNDIDNDSGILTGTK